VLSEKIKVKNNQELVRDVNSGAILNTNLDAVRSYKNKKNELNKVSDLSNKITTLESDMKEIKNLLKSLIEGTLTNVNQHK
jgi:prefoldin subunit 5